MQAGTATGMGEDYDLDAAQDQKQQPQGQQGGY
jgi:hypothetical protein